MAARTPVIADKGLKSPLFSQAIKCNDMIYVSGNIGIVTETMSLVEGSVSDRTRQALNNIKIVLEEGGSSLRNIVKCNIYLTDMTNYAAMNKVYIEMIGEPRPARTCVCVAELPFKTDVGTPSVSILQFQGY